MAVFLNFSFDFFELKYCIKLTECSAIIFSTEVLDKAEAIKASSLDHLICIEVGINTSQSESYNSIIESFSKRKSCVSVSQEDSGAIYFSSGRTVLPKANLLTHKVLMANAQTEQKHRHQSSIEAISKEHITIA